MFKIRNLLYLLAKLLGDISSIQRKRTGRRIGRRIAGKGTGRLLRKFFK